jgi:hypothetical protein
VESFGAARHPSCHGHLVRSVGGCVSGGIGCGFRGSDSHAGGGKGALHPTKDKLATATTELFKPKHIRSHTKCHHNNRHPRPFYIQPTKRAI